MACKESHCLCIADAVFTGNCEIRYPSAALADWDTCAVAWEIYVLPRRFYGDVSRCVAAAASYGGILHSRTDSVLCIRFLTATDPGTPMGK